MSPSGSAPTFTSPRGVHALPREKFSVILPNKRQVEVPASPSDNVHTLKQRVLLMEGIPPPTGPIVAKQNNKTLNDAHALYKVTNPAPIVLVCDRVLGWCVRLQMLGGEPHTVRYGMHPPRTGFPRGKHATQRAPSCSRLCRRAQQPHSASRLRSFRGVPLCRHTWFFSPLT